MLDLELWGRLNATKKYMSAITVDEVNLFNCLSIKLDNLKGDDFKIISSAVGDGIDYNITTSNKGLPERVGLLFFDLDKNYEVKCLEISDEICSETDSERKYIITINKY